MPLLPVKTASAHINCQADDIAKTDAVVLSGSEPEIHLTAENSVAYNFAFIFHKC